jgi:molybdopterin converting factor small subunit
MRIHVSFYSYFQDLTGCADTSEAVASGSTIQDLFSQLAVRFPRLAGMGKSSLFAVGIDYQDRAYVLKEGDEVSMFPPVQGG